MRIIIVGQQNGCRKICWLNVLALTTVLCLIMGFGAGAFYYLLAGEWNHTAILRGAMMGVGLVIMGLAGGLQTPVHQLTELKR